VLLLDNQSTFDLCCNKTFASKIIKVENAPSMASNGGGLKITEKQQESHHEHHLPQKPDQVLSGNL